MEDFQLWSDFGLSLGHEESGPGFIQDEMSNSDFIQQKW